MHRSKDPHVVSGAKVHSTAVIVMPPQELWAPIQQIRSVHDKAYERWMPHINMLYPFVPDKDFDQWAPKLQAALGEFGAFELTFGSVNSFAHGASSTLFLQADAAAVTVLKRIQARLEATVPICNDLSHISAQGFTPHLTLGQWNTTAASKAALASLNAAWKPITFTVKELFLISRGRTTPFEIKCSVALRGAAVPPPAAAAAVAAPPPSASSVPAAASSLPVEPIEPAGRVAASAAPQRRQLHPDPPADVTVVDVTDVIPPSTPNPDRAEVLRKVLSWYRVNRTRNMLPKTRAKLENAIAPLCQVHEEVNFDAVWVALMSERCFTLAAQNKVVYNRTKIVLAPKDEAVMHNGYEYVEKPAKTALAAVIEHIKEWLLGNRDPPRSHEGLRNCVKQLCHHKKLFKVAEIVQWLEERRLLEEVDEQIVYHFEKGQWQPPPPQQQQP